MITPMGRAGRLAMVAVLAGVVAFMATPASADDASDATTVAWSVSPADEVGNADSRTRLEMELAPGETGTTKVVVSNASTIDQTFAVYGADAINTSVGGYDLDAAAVVPDDVGAWVTVSQPSVTIPALSSAAIDVTVAVPADATPGDHPGGVVVGLANPTANDSGVLLDTRVAVRLSVRVPGELAPAIDVRKVAVDYDGALLPFGAGKATVTYEVTNTGNVTIAGSPRLRVTGPFGLRLATLAADTTQEVLPGQSFTVTSVIHDVEPGLVDNAVVTVDMVAAPGSEEELPLVSATTSATFVAVPWTGIALVVIVLAAALGTVRWLRRRRAEGEELWASMVESAKAEAAASAGASSAGFVSVGAAITAACVTLLLVGAAGFAAAATTTGAATGDTPSVQQTERASISLRVPAAPSASAAPSGAVLGTGNGSGTSTGGTTGGSTTWKPSSSVGAGAGTDDAAEQAEGQPEDAASSTPEADPTDAVVGAAPDLNTGPASTGQQLWRTLLWVLLGAVIIAVGFGISRMLVIIATREGPAA